LDYIWSQRGLLVVRIIQPFIALLKRFYDSSDELFCDCWEQKVNDKRQRDNGGNHTFVTVPAEAIDSVTIRQLQEFCKAEDAKYRKMSMR
jgi:hypothetical protein